MLISWHLNLLMLQNCNNRHHIHNLQWFQTICRQILFYLRLSNSLLLFLQYKLLYIRKTSLKIFFFATKFHFLHMKPYFGQNFRQINKNVEISNTKMTWFQLFLFFNVSNIIFIFCKKTFKLSIWSD